MISNLEKYKKDLDTLIKRGDDLYLALRLECFPIENFEDELNRLYKGKEKEKLRLSAYKKSLPNFDSEYQKWYSESLALITQLLPERTEDFSGFYKKPKTTRKDITYENYVIEDALVNLVAIRRAGGEEIIADKKSAICKFKQQLSILKSVEKRFESSLFDIKQLTQADLFDSELETAEELNKKGYTRAAGAVAGVVLESHLLQVCENHKITIRKKNPTINDLAQLLKENGVIETPNWRKIQHLADLRNLCDHKKETDPTSEQIDELIEGVSRVIKNLF